jgi:hypothetical protein
VRKRFVLSLILIIVSWCVAFDGARYLIIAPDNYVSSVQPLADWKTKKGVKAIVVSTSVTGSSNTQIKNYIVNAYNTWRIKPEYILLIGAGNVLASWNLGSQVYSDDPYADISGNLLIELSIGRLPCTSVSQCQNIVNKIISYFFNQESPVSSISSESEESEGSLFTTVSKPNLQGISDSPMHLKGPAVKNDEWDAEL